jgi:hypothetical protein
MASLLCFDRRRPAKLPRNVTTREPRTRHQPCRIVHSPH